jgi:hypothetical protein
MSYSIVAYGADCADDTIPVLLVTIRCLVTTGCYAPAVLVSMGVSNLAQGTQMCCPGSPLGECILLTASVV